MDDLFADLLQSSPTAHLATSDQYAKPHVVPIVFVWEAPYLYSPLDAKPKRDDDWHSLRRVRNLETNGRASVVVDRYAADWTHLAWVLLDGLAVILESGEERDRAAAALEAKYPQYARLPLAGRPIVKITVERTVCWSAADGREL